MSNPVLGRVSAGALALAISTCLFAAGEPGLLLAPPNPGEPVELAQQFYIERAADYGFTARDAEHIVSDVVPTRHNGVTHVYLQQSLGSIPIEGAITTVNVMPDGAILSVGSNFLDDVEQRAGDLRRPQLTADAAVAATASYLGVALGRAPQRVGGDGGVRQHSVFREEALSAADIPVRLVYERVGEELRLAWSVVVDRMDAETFYADLRIDAATGEVLEIHSYVAHADGHGGVSEAAAKGGVLDHSVTYRVVPAPFESPGHAGATHTLVTDPHDPVASPRGWHDTRSSGAGYETSDTRGNNVLSRLDLNAIDSGPTTAGTDSGGDLTFDFFWTDTTQPDQGSNLDAAVVNLFYWNNYVHDVLYHYGFDESGGNFQTNNFGLGGLGNDRVVADALDGSAENPPNTNNANFGTPPDGSSGRMQMFRWLAPYELAITTPGKESTHPAYRAGFGEFVQGIVTGEVVPVESGGAVSIEGCTAITNGAAIAGKIALIRRGNCEFGLKALNAQNAGAGGVLIFNNVEGSLSMGAGVNGGSVTIEVLGTTQAGGDALLAALAEESPIEVAMQVDSTFGADRDSDFDAGIIAHEYGHGVSNRLTGGPSAAGCVGGNERAGEGWSDYIGLMTTFQAHYCSVPLGIGTYASFEPNDGPGIRPFRYSTDMTINPATYDTIKTGVTIPHGVGTVWATMIWDMTCMLVDEYGIDQPIGGTGGNNLALQLVMDGMKMQQCNPTFVQSRDAVIAADVANNGGANRCAIWELFARRGLGASALGGSSASNTDGTEAFDMPEDCVEFSVTAEAGPGGSISEAGAQSAYVDSVLVFDVMPDSGFAIDSVTGCDGTLDGTEYTTAPIVGDCTVSASFIALAPEVFADGFED